MLLIGSLVGWRIPMPDIFPSSMAGSVCVQVQKGVDLVVTPQNQIHLISHLDGEILNRINLGPAKKENLSGIKFCLNQIDAFCK